MKRADLWKLLQISCIPSEGAIQKADPAPDANFPKDAVNEWPAPKQIHFFYFVRFQSYEDPTLKTKIELAVKEIQQKNQARFRLTEVLKEKKNTFYYQNRTLLKNAKDLAAKKNIAALEELSHIEVEIFMVLWSRNKAFRDDYEKKDIAITGQLTIE